MFVSRAGVRTMVHKRVLIAAVAALHATSCLAFSASPALVNLAGIGGASSFTPCASKAALPVAEKRATLVPALRSSLADFGVESRIPENPAKTKCACGSGKSYEDCCKTYHESGKAPTEPEATIRARYSAFAYAIPNFIMASTHPKSDDYKDNKGEWEQELVDFCQSYRFHRRGERVLGVKIEECRYLGMGDEASIQFRARMIGPGQKLVTFWERSRLLKRDDRWLYKSGSLLEFEGPLL